MRWMTFSIILSSYISLAMNQVVPLDVSKFLVYINAEQEYGPLYFRDAVNFANPYWDQALNALLDCDAKKMALLTHKLTKQEKEALAKIALWSRVDADNELFIKALLMPIEIIDTHNTRPRISLDLSKINSTSPRKLTTSGTIDTPKSASNRISVAFSPHRLKSPRLSKHQKMRPATPRGSLSGDSIQNHEELSMSKSYDAASAAVTFCASEPSCIQDAPF